MRLARSWSDVCAWARRARAALGTGPKVRLAAPVAALVLLSGLALPADGRGEVLAVIAGIDDYQHVTDLDGAVADAIDLNEALGWLGARTALVLDRAADRDSLLGLLAEAVAAAGAGDVVVFSFAGHGIQVPDRDGDEGDGFDEAFVLSGYRPGDEDWDNLILDDDLDQIIRQAAPSTVVLLADSCHSGTMLRGRDRRADFRKVRALPRASFGSRPLTVAPRGEAFPSSNVPGNLVFFGAVAEHLGVQEVLIDGRPRGALSYAFARAIQGAADRDQDAVVTSDELMVQVAERVRVLSAGRQTPSALIGSDSRKLAFRLPGVSVVPAPPGPSGALAEAAGTTGAPDLGRLRVAVRGANGAGETVLAGLHGIEVVSAPETADLIVDQPSGDILTSTGDVAARLGPARGRRLVQGIIDKWRLLKGLAGAVDGSLETRVLPADQLFTDGMPFALQIRAHAAGYLVLFDLASDGSLLMLYPGRGGRARWLAAGEARTIELRAGPPFGADHLIAALIPEARLQPVLDLLAEVHGRPLSPGQAKRLDRLLRDATASLPTSVYTAP